MALPPELEKMYCFIFNKTYFDCTIRKNGIKVGNLIQREPNNIKGGDLCLISKKFKMAWYKPISPMYFKPSSAAEIAETQLKESSSIIFVDGTRFFCVLDVESAIPLYEDKSLTVETIIGDLVIKKSEVISLKTDEKALTEKKKSKVKAAIGSPVKLKTIDIIPTMLFELTNAYFVTLTMKQPKNKFEELAPVLIVAVLAISFLVWYMMSTGGIHGI